eukprot:scaffold2133_cov135-Isochrysis_galbana.AAC.1
MIVSKLRRVASSSMPRDAQQVPRGRGALPAHPLCEKNAPNVASCLKRVRCGMASANAASQRMPARTLACPGSRTGRRRPSLRAIRPSACSSCRDARAVGRGCAPAVTCGGEAALGKRNVDCSDPAGAEVADPHARAGPPHAPRLRSYVSDLPRPSTPSRAAPAARPARPPPLACVVATPPHLFGGVRPPPPHTPYCSVSNCSCGNLARMASAGGDGGGGE